MFVVAGASGRTGKVVAETLLSQGKKVRVIVRDPHKGEPWRARGAEVAVASLDDARAIERALAAVTGFFTFLPEDGGVHDFNAHRRRIADATCAAVRESHVPHVAVLSGTAAFLSHGNGLAKELHYLENLLLGVGSRVTVIRAVGFQENVAMALPAARHEGVYPNFMPSADVAFPTVATRDIGRFAASCLVETPAKSEIVDMLGPAYSVRQMAEKLGVALGKTLRLVDVPAPAHVDVLTRAGLPKQFAESLAEFFACVASGRVSPRGDRTVTGKTTLDEILPGLIAATA